MSRGSSVMGGGWKRVGWGSAMKVHYGGEFGGIREEQYSR